MTDKLFFDTDCISSFLWVDETNIITELYGGRIVLPEPVYNELSNPCVQHLKQRMDILLNARSAEVKIILEGTEEYELYNKLIQGGKGVIPIGHGEAGGVALAKVYDGILASNNYRDIAVYIEKYNLQHTDTGLIMKEALEKRIITEEQGNEIWGNMLARRRILPAGSFTEYLESLNNED